MYFVGKDVSVHYNYKWAVGISPKIAEDIMKNFFLKYFITDMSPVSLARYASDHTRRLLQKNSTKPLQQSYSHSPSLSVYCASYLC